jgi:hypothetical protein
MWRVAFVSVLRHQNKSCPEGLYVKMDSFLLRGMEEVEDVQNEDTLKNLLHPQDCHCHSYFCSQIELFFG